MWAILRWFLYTFLICYYHFLSMFLIYTTRYSRFTLYFPHSNPGIIQINLILFGGFCRLRPRNSLCFLFLYYKWGQPHLLWHIHPFLSAAAPSNLLSRSLCAFHSLSTSFSWNSQRGVSKVYQITLFTIWHSLRSSFCILN